VRGACDNGDAAAAADLIRNGDGRARDLAREFQQMFHGLGITISVLAAETERTEQLPGADVSAVWRQFAEKYRSRAREAWPESSGSPSPLATDDKPAWSQYIDELLSWGEGCYRTDSAARAAEILAAVEAGEFDSAGRLLNAKIDEGYRPLHDALIDVGAEMFAKVYAAGGRDLLMKFHLGMADAQRAGIDAWDHGGSRTVASAMVALLVQHLGDLKVVEESDRYVVDQALCGSGGRLIRSGAYNGPAALPVVPGPAEVTGGQASMPVYCTHCPAWNTVAPQEWYGHAHVVPDGAAQPDGSCRLLIPKFDAPSVDRAGSRQ
jgi:hypothetical protein